MNIILFDDKDRINLLPLTYTRPMADMRVGIMTLREKWEHYFGLKTSTITEDYLSQKFPLVAESANLLINGSVLPDDELVKAIEKLEEGQALVKDNLIVALQLAKEQVISFSGKVDNASDYAQVNYQGEILKIKGPWDIFSLNGKALEMDFKRLTQGRKSAQLSKSNQIIGDRIFVEESAVSECAIINANSGPIYLGHHCEVMEGSIIRGSLALGEHSVLKLGAKIYGPTTIGPHCKVGGEVSNSVIFGYSNKAHDGFLGNSVLGEWCNLGADTNTSNLKNNYAEVKLWNYAKEAFVKTGLQFCGLIMGDHSKCGINTMFNTGTVAGVSANIFGSGFPRNFIPSFSWGGAQGFDTFALNKAFEVAEKVMERRGLKLDETEKNILKNIFEQSHTHRYWEKQNIKV